MSGFRFHWHKLALSSRSSDERPRESASDGRLAERRLPDERMWNAAFVQLASKLKRI